MLTQILIIAATMTKIIKEMLPPDVRVARDTQDLLIECCVGEIDNYFIIFFYPSVKNKQPDLINFHCCSIFRIHKSNFIRIKRSLWQRRQKNNCTRTCTQSIRGLLLMYVTLTTYKVTTLPPYHFFSCIHELN